MMRKRETTITLLVLALFLLITVVSAEPSLPFDLPTNDTSFALEEVDESYPPGRCGRQAAGRKCPTGQCCSISGWCGSTSAYCGRLCQSQCVIEASYPPGRCGRQAEGRKCPTGQCCSISGWCGSTTSYCGRLCQSQCVIPPPPSYPQGRCGDQTGFRVSCPTGQCCSIAGWCGSTPDYCSKYRCQSQCKTASMRGIESFLLMNAV